MVISLAPTLFSCAKFWSLRVIIKNKKDIILLTLNWPCGPAGFAPTNWPCGPAGFAPRVWQTAQNGRLHKTGGTYYYSCIYPTDSAWPAFLMPFLLLLPVSGHLSRGFTVPPAKRAYSALHPQALTECSPLDFRRSSISAIYHIARFSVTIRRP